jgi:peptide/nickel transport system permease protein
LKVVRYISKRIVLAVITLFVVTLIVFVAARASGDVTLLLAPAGASEEVLQQVRHEYGLDKPVPVQYLIFVRDALHGNFGKSIRFQEPAMRVVERALPPTLELAFFSFVIGNLVGLGLGVLTAVKRNWLLQGAGKIFAMLGQAIPGFWLGVMFILLFSVTLHWLPTSGRGGLSHLILPVAAMSWYSVSLVMRITRSAVLDTLDSDYVKMARVKGNPERRVVIRHALRNALIPIIAVAGLQLTVLIGGMAFIETTFNWQGIGQLMVNSINARDYPLIQAIVLVIAVAIVMINFLVDMLYMAVDPRIKYS